MRNENVNKIIERQNKYSIQVQYMHCDYAGKMLTLNGSANRKGWGWNLSILPRYTPE